LILQMLEHADQVLQEVESSPPAPTGDDSSPASTDEPRSQES